MTSQPNAVGVFIYAGGFTVGMQRQGFNVLGHFEDEKPYAEATMRRNLGLDAFPYPHWQSIREHLGGESVDIIYGNPPCCAWSQAGKGLREGRDSWMTNPATLCTRKLFNLLEREQPKILAWESVLNSLGWGHALFAELAQRAIELGYSFTAIPHNAYWHGSIQSRIRVIYVCSKLELLVQEPDFTRTETVLERLATVEPGGPPSANEEHFHRKYGWLLKHARQGQKLRDVFEEMSADGRHVPVIKPNGHVEGRPMITGYFRLRGDGPSNTMIGHPFIHPIEDRLLTLNEMSAIADFPNWWKWGSFNGVLNEMARGVSTYMGDWLGASAMATLEANEPVADPCFNFIDLRKPATERDPWSVFRKQRKAYSFDPLIGLDNCVACGGTFKNTKGEPCVCVTKLEEQPPELDQGEECSVCGGTGLEGPYQAPCANCAGVGRFDP